MISSLRSVSLSCLSVCLFNHLRSWLFDYSGLMGKPKVMPVPTAFKITSSDDSQSSMLVVTRNEVQATMTTYFGNDDLFFTSTVTFKNVGDVTITNLKCKHSSIVEKESEGKSRLEKRREEKRRPVEERVPELPRPCILHAALLTLSTLYVCLLCQSSS